MSFLDGSSKLTMDDISKIRTNSSSALGGGSTQGQTSSTLNSADSKNSSNSNSNSNSRANGGDDDDDDDDIITHQYKIILLGDGAVGKTSIATRFTEDAFKQMYKQTVGVDFFIKRIVLSPKHHATLQIWDIGGQSIGSKMITNYITGAHAVLLCYDITNYESFANLEDWYRLVTKTFSGGQKMPLTALLGNKNDLKHLTAVRPDQHNKFADENEMASFLLSAKSGDQINYAFSKMAATLAGVQHVRRDSEAVVTATIIDHQRHDSTVNQGQVPEYVKSKGGVLDSCALS